MYANFYRTFLILYTYSDVLTLSYDSIKCEKNVFIIYDVFHKYEYVFIKYVGPKGK